MQKAGYRVIAFELPWSTMDMVNAALEAPESDVHALAIHLRTFASTASIQLLNDIKTWNKMNPADKVMLGGFDTQQPFFDYHAIKVFLQIQAQSQGLSQGEEAQLVKSLSVCSGGEGFSSHDDWLTRDGGSRAIQKEAYDACISQLEKIERNVPESHWQLRAHIIGFKNAQEMAFLNSLPASESQKLAIQARDTAMKKIWSLHTQNAWKDKKQVMWMHIFHASKHTEMIPDFNVKSVGSQIAEEVGDKYKVLVTSAFQIENGKSFRSARKVPGAPSFEHTLHSARTPFLFADIASAAELFPKGQTFSFETNMGQILQVFPADFFDAAVFVPFANGAKMR